MKAYILAHWKRFELLLCLLVGVVVAACFYYPYGAPVVWFLLIPVFLVLFHEQNSRKRTLGAACLFVFPFLFTSYLVGFTIDVGFSPALMFLLDLALIVVVCLVQGIPLVAALYFGTRLSFPKPLRAGLVATLWTAAEWICTAGPFAFPVRNLAVSQWAFTPVVRISSLLGTLFISFLIILVPALFAQGARAFWLKRREEIKKIDFASDPKAKLRIKEGRAYNWTALILFFVVTWGSDYVIPPVTPTDYVEVVAVQHNVSAEASARTRFDASVALAEKALSADPKETAQNPQLTYVTAGGKPWQGGDVLLFPESTAQFLSENEYMQGELRRLATTYRVDILVGGVKRSREKPEDGANQTDAYIGSDDTDTEGEGSAGLRDLGAEKEEGALLENAVYFMDREGKLRETHYAKQLLVPFFENGNIQPFNFFPGNQRGLFSTAKTEIGTLVCFESLIAKSVRETVQQGAKFIAVASNDAYLESPQIKSMHFSQNFFRAVESGRAVIQASTNGITGVADANGRYVTAQNGQESTRAILPIEEEGVLLVQLPLYNNTTLYTRIGDSWIAILILAALLLFCIRAFWGRLQG